MPAGAGLRFDPPTAASLAEQAWPAEKKTIELWFGQQWPETNIGIATGKRSDLFVLDVDGPKGEATLLALMKRYGPLPDTLTAITGRGKHFYFRHPAEVIKTSAGFLGEGLDTRGDGGYVVAPPSRHSCGCVYRWENPYTPVQEAPAWLIDRLAGEKKALDTKPNAPLNIDQSYGAILEGRRNDTLFKHACALRGQGAESEQIKEHLMELNENKCLPPLDAKEVEQGTGAPTGSERRKPDGGR